MKRLVLLAALLLSLTTTVSAQRVVAGRLFSGTGAPTANCVPGPPVTDLYLRTDTKDLYACSALPNVWVVVSGGGGGGGGSFATLTGTPADNASLQAALDLKANSASPALTGTPTAPTAAAGTNTTQLATTAHVFAERSNTSTLTGKTMSGASNTFTALPAAGITGVIPIANLATGTPDGTQFIRDDGTLAPAPGGGDMSLASVQTVTAAKTFNDGTLILNGGDYGPTEGSLPAGVEKGLYLNTNASSRRLYIYNDGAYRALFQAGVDQVNLASGNVTGVLPLANGGTNNEQTIQLVAVDFATDTAVGDGKDYFVVPARLNGYNLVGVRADVFTVGTTGNLNVELDKCAAVATGSKCSGTVAAMLTTNISVDTNEDDSDTAATPAAIDTANDGVVTGDTIRVNIMGVHTTPAKGLVVTLRFQLP